MKKIAAFTFAILFAGLLAAQDEPQSSNNSQGRRPAMWIGGGMGFGSQSSLDYTFIPNFGLLFAENMGAGITLNLSGGDNQFQWGLEPYFRYYIPVVEQFKFYGDAFFGVGGGDTNTTVDGGNYSTLDFGVRAGLQYWFTPRWSMAASTNILTYNSRDNNGEFGAGLSFNSLNLSLFFHF